MTIRSLVLKIFSEPNVFAGYDQVKLTLAAALEKGGAEGEKIAKEGEVTVEGDIKEGKEGDKKDERSRSRSSRDGSKDRRFVWSFVSLVT